jgi:hypothetical protein
VIPEACANIAYSIVSAKRDAFRDASSICKTRVTSVTGMGDPYAGDRKKRKSSKNNEGEVCRHRRSRVLLLSNRARRVLLLRGVVDIGQPNSEFRACSRFLRFFNGEE